jgi:putative transport protein
MLGVVLFVYTLGLSAGPAFVAALHNKGVRDNLFALGMVAIGGILLMLGVFALGVHGPMAAGMYAGSFNSTPALAAVLENLKNTAHASDPVVGYALTYPAGLLAVLLSIAFFEKHWRIDYRHDSKGKLHARTIRVMRTDAPTIKEAIQLSGANVNVSRIDMGDGVQLARSKDRLEKNSRIAVVGTSADIETLAEYLGHLSNEDQLQYDRRIIDATTMFLSNPKLAGRTVGSLGLRKRYGVIVTRLRRGDAGIIVHADTVLELGDRLRVVGPRDQLKHAAASFGDSYRSVSEFNILTFTGGICLGLLVGSIPLPLPGGSTFHLGFAGGPLIVALTLGALGRTGPVLWQLPYSTSVAIRQIGLMVFLAAIGTQAGGSLSKALSDPSSLAIVAIGATAAAVMTVISLLVGYKVLKVPFTVLSGIVSGIQTQPAALAFANERSHSDKPSVGYTTVYPLVMIVKIVVVQLVLMFMMSKSA